MTELLPLVAALLVGLLYDPSREGPFPPAADRAALAVAGAVVLSAIFGLALELTRRRSVAGRAWSRAWTLFRIHPLLLHAACVHLFHWPVVADAIGVGGVGTLVSILVVAPFLATQAVVWAWVWRIEWRGGPRLRAWLGHSFRSVALLLLPYLAYAAASDGLASSRTLRVFVESWSAAEAALLLALFLSLGFLFPLAARRIWKTRRLGPGELRERLEEAARRVSFRFRDLLVWDTADLSVNAAILGVFPRWRFVVLTDGLLRSLAPEEIEAVFGHEAGHARRHHVLSFFLFAASLALVGAYAARHALPETEAAALGALAATTAAGWLAFGWLSRRFELEADLDGAAAVGSVDTFVSALERVGRVTGQSHARGGWRHFSVGSRVRFLRQAEADPRIADALHARIRRVVRLGVLALVVAVGLQAVDLARRTPAEIGWARLRLGDYAAAERWLARADAKDAAVGDRLALARFGRELEAESGGSPAAVRDLLIEAIDRNDVQFVRSLLDLVGAVSDGEAEGLEEATALARAGDLPELRRLLDRDGERLVAPAIAR